MTINKGGRPKTEAYRKLIFRYSKVEDTLQPFISQMQNEHDKQLILNALEQLKSGAKKENLSNG